MPSRTRLGALKVVNPSQWKREIIVAMQTAGGHIPEAAENLGVSGRQLARWLELDEMKDVLRAPSGVHREEEVVEYPSRKKKAS